MFADLIERIVREEVQKLLGTAKAAPTPPAAAAGVLFVSPKEAALLEHLRNEGPKKQAQLIASFEDQMNTTAVKEILANLVHRRLITKGPDGYTPAT